MSTQEEKERLEQLVLRCQSGDKEAFGDLYDLLAEKIYRFVFFKTKAEDAEDLTEIIFLKIWEKIASYTNTETAFTAWALKIANNTVIDYYRTHRPLFPLSETADLTDENDENNPKTIAEKSLNQTFVQAALRELPAPYREIIVLKYIEDLSNEEISLVTDRSQISVRVMHHRALHKLKAILNRKGCRKM